MQPLRTVSTSLALLSLLLLLLLSLGSNHWLVNNSGIVQGLWQICYNSICEKYSAVKDYVDATRAFLFLATFAGGFSSVAVITSFFRSHLSSMSLTLVSAVGSFSAGLCAMIAMAMFTGKVVAVTQGMANFGWSFGLGWASFPLFLITGAVTMFIPKPPSS